MRARIFAEENRKWWTLGAVAFGLFMIMLDNTVVFVALAAIQQDLQISTSELQWVVNGYALTFAGFLLLGGRAADLFGGRRVFLGALTVFTIASLACGVATADWALVASRVVQGLSAGVLAPATLSILTTTYRDPEARNRALAIWTAAALGGGAIGGLLGGLLTGGLSWRWVFFVNVPVGAVLLALARRHLPRPAPDSGRRELDLGGAVTVTGGVTALVWGLIRAEEAGWDSGEVLVAFAIAVALLGAFVLLETRIARAPLVPFSAFRSRALTAANLLSFLSFVPVMATWFFLSLYLQSVQDLTPMQTGLLFLPMSLAVVGGSQLSFRAIARLDARGLFLGGGLVAAAGLAWLGLLSSDTGVVWVILPASVAMLGGGLMFAPIMVAGTSDVAADEGGLASGLLNTTRQIGGAVGLAALGTIAAANADAGTGAGQAAALSAGYATALGVGAAIYVATAIVGAFVLPAKITSAAPEENDASSAESAMPSRAREGVTV